MKEDQATVDFLEGVRIYRHMPWLQRGLLIDVAGKRGIVVDGNASMNIQVKFPATGETLNCHPTWETTYYRGEDVIADYKLSCPEKEESK